MMLSFFVRKWSVRSPVRVFYSYDDDDVDDDYDHDAFALRMYRFVAVWLSLYL